MAKPSVGDWVGEITSTEGTGTIGLGGPIEGFAPFSSMPDGEVWYSINDAGNRESGKGTLSGDGTFLERTEIHAIMVDGVFVSLPEDGLILSGLANVYCTFNRAAFDMLNAALDKLDVIEDGATADQTAEEIKALYESNYDTFVFDSAAKDKLDGIEAGATADQSADEVSYVPTETGQSATDVQAAISEAFANANSSKQTAAEVPFTSGVPGFTDAEVKSALDTLYLKSGGSISQSSINLDGNDDVVLGYDNAYVITNFKFDETYEVSTPDLVSGLIIGDLVTITPSYDYVGTTITFTVSIVGGDSTTYTIDVVSFKITRPTINTPYAGETGVLVNSTIEASPFSSLPIAALSHTHTSFQIASDAGFTNILEETGDFDPVTSFTPTVCTGGVLYYVRVKYGSLTDGGLVESEWSAIVPFVTFTLGTIVWYEVVSISTNRNYYRPNTPLPFTVSDDDAYSAMLQEDQSGQERMWIYDNSTGASGWTYTNINVDNSNNAGVMDCYYANDQFIFKAMAGSGSGTGNQFHNKCESFAADIGSLEISKTQVYSGSYGTTIGVQGVYIGSYREPGSVDMICYMQYNYNSLKTIDVPLDVYSGAVPSTTLGVTVSNLSNPWAMIDSVNRDIMFIGDGFSSIELFTGNDFTSVANTIISKGLESITQIGYAQQMFRVGDFVILCGGNLESVYAIKASDISTEATEVMWNPVDNTGDIPGDFSRGSYSSGFYYNVDSNKLYFAKYTSSSNLTIWGAILPF